MGKYLSGLLGWIGIALVVYFGFILSLLVGLLLHSVAMAFCPESEIVSGICTAPWFAWVERGITLTVAALAGAMVVLFAAAAAERAQRRTAAVAALVIGVVVAMLMAESSGPSDGGLLLEALVATCCGILALYRVHRQLDPRRQKARYEARKKSRKKSLKRSLKKSSVGKRKKKVRRWHRRRPQQSLDPGSPSPAIGKAAMAAYVLLGLWCVFMILMLVTHRPDGLETETLSRFEEMFAWWMLAALLMMLFLAVEMAGRAVVSPARHLRRLATDIIALIMVTLMMATNAQFSHLYSFQSWERRYAHVPSHTIRGDFSYPSMFDPGSRANKEWLEFQEWLDWAVFRASAVRLEFQPEQPIRHLAQCTPDLWLTQCQEIRFRVGDGPEHHLREPWRKRYYDVLLPSEDGSLDAFVLLALLEAGPFRDQVAPKVDVQRIPASGPVEREELEKMIQDSDRYSPLQLLVPRDATAEWLDSLLLRLEEQGAEFFILIFYG